MSVFLNDRKVFADPHVSTRHEISRAASFTVPLAGEDGGALTVILPERGIEATIRLEPTMRYLSLSLRGTELTHRFSESPFRYM